MEKPQLRHVSVLQETWIGNASMDVTTISSQYLGDHKLFVGNAVVYATRISRAGKGNRCVVGPLAARTFKEYGLEGPYFIAGKPENLAINIIVLTWGKSGEKGPMAKRLIGAKE
jgi:hypothetical protein